LDAVEEEENDRDKNNWKWNSMEVEENDRDKKNWIIKLFWKRLHKQEISVKKWNVGLDFSPSTAG